jgi:phage terminase small subunit
MDAAAKLRLQNSVNSSTWAGARAIDENKKLTPQQTAFVTAIVEGDNPLNAYVRAGYASTSVKSKKEIGSSYAYRMMEMPNIKKAIRIQHEHYIEQSKMTKKKVMDGLIESIEMAKLMSEPMTMVSGWREIGKLCGFYEPTRHKVDVSVNGTMVLEQMNSLSDEELLKLISEGSAQALLAPPEPADDQN